MLAHGLILSVVVGTKPNSKLSWKSRGPPTTDEQYFVFPKLSTPSRNETRVWSNLTRPSSVANNGWKSSVSVVDHQEAPLSEVLANFQLFSFLQSETGAGVVSRVTESSLSDKLLLQFIFRGCPASFYSERGQEASLFEVLTNFQLFSFLQSETGAGVVSRVTESSLSDKLLLQFTWFLFWGVSKLHRRAVLCFPELSIPSRIETRCWSILTRPSSIANNN